MRSIDSDGIQRLRQVGYYVVYMLRSYRQSYRSGSNALVRQLRRGELRVRRSGRMNYQRLDIGYVRQQRENFQLIYERVRLLLPSFDFERKNRPSAFREIFLI